eukprot:1191762-Pleurochrysis_carterae.AAC.1
MPVQFSSWAVSGAAEKVSEVLSHLKYLPTVNETAVDEKLTGASPARRGAPAKRLSASAHARSWPAASAAAEDSMAALPARTAACCCRLSEARRELTAESMTSRSTVPALDSPVGKFCVSSSM